MVKDLFPNKILSLSNKVFETLVVLLVLVITLGLIYALFISPPDYIQGNSVRIMYVHVPASFLALACFGFIGIISAAALIFKIKILRFESIMNRSMYM